MKLYQEIMNIQITVDRSGWLPLEKNGYAHGHRDACHAAAELSLKAETRIEELEEALKAFVNWTTNEAGTLALVDDEELWKRAEDVLK